VKCSLFVIQGADNLAKWIKHGSSYAIIEENKITNDILYVVEESDEYFFVIENTRSTKALGSISFKTEAMIFDTEKGYNC
jgi:hypothetical protein